MPADLPTLEELDGLESKHSQALSTASFAREAWRGNDGAEGDAVRLLCDFAEAVAPLIAAARRVHELEGRLYSERAEMEDMRARAEQAEREREELRREVADLKESLAIADEELNQYHPDR